MLHTTGWDIFLNWNIVGDFQAKQRDETVTEHTQSKQQYKLNIT